jgi:hypothetical protein
VPGRHPPHRLAGAEEAAGDVEVEHGPQRLEGHVLDPADRPDRAGVVDQGSEPPEFGIDRLEQADHVGFAGDVTLDDGGALSGRLDLGRDRLRRFAAAPIVERDVIAAGAGEPGDCRADAARRAGDEKDAAHA